MGVGWTTSTTLTTTVSELPKSYFALSTQAIHTDENQNPSKDYPPSALIDHRRVEAERLWLPSP